LLHFKTAAHQSWVCFSHLTAIPSSNKKPYMSFHTDVQIESPVSE
jgi:hypothetical protein